MTQEEFIIVIKEYLNEHNPYARNAKDSYVIDLAAANVLASAHGWLKYLCDRDIRFVPMIPIQESDLGDDDTEKGEE